MDALGWESSIRGRRKPGVWGYDGLSDFASSDPETLRLWLEPDRDWAEYFRLAWSGPYICAATEVAAQINREVRRAFCSYNMIVECVDRWLSGVLSKEPTIEATGSDGSQDSEILNRINRLKREVRRDAVHSDNAFNSPVLEAMRLWYATGEAYLRCYVSPESGRVKVHVCDRRDLAIEYNTSQEIDRITYHYRQARGNGQEGLKEVQLIDGEGRTVFRVYGEYDDLETAQPRREFRLLLGGRFTVLVMRRSPAITTPIKSLQRALNNELTVLGQNSKFAGFLRELVLNSQPPGHWVEDDSPAGIASGGSRFVPAEAPLAIGPGQTTFLSGLPRYDAAGNIVGYESPSVVHKDPVPPGGFLETIEAYRRAIAQSFGQAHALSSDVVMSEDSRLQARSDYKDLLQLDCAVIEVYLEYLYAVLLLLGSDATTAQADSIRVTCHPDPGVPTSAQVGATRENYKTGMIDLETALNDLGYENPQEIIERLNRESSQAAASNRPIDPTNPLLLP